ncbi:hypothetical protein SmJEL517_g01341 [Synchytrium microbalum]|uniref:Pre-mRNA-splicing factor n=1 Tax=Synchytrium microbalum TaxID=1806994 RepID=A0A507CFF0_9FUNG|nr:uncharacterized protein SmJEL517_g01341 [Synchytrium microbalum]TPX36654.1 hypothetical protein SmJEL517_g01341 [Synchytrium microbalum]
MTKRSRDAAAEDLGFFSSIEADIEPEAAPLMDDAPIEPETNTKSAEQEVKGTGSNQKPSNNEPTTRPTSKSRTKESSSGIYAPSFAEASQDPLSHLAKRYWSIPDLVSRPSIPVASTADDGAEEPTGKKVKAKKAAKKKAAAAEAESTAEPTSKWNPDVIKQIWTDLVKSGFSRSKIMLLEYLQTLENYLWPHFNPEESTLEHVLCLVININEKFREKQFSVWSSFLTTPDTDSVKFAAFFKRVIQLLLTPLDLNSYTYTYHTTATKNIELDLQIRRFLLVFMIHSFASLETSIVRSECLKLAGVSTWSCLVDEDARESIFKKAVSTRKLWNRAEKKHQLATSAAKTELEVERSVISELIKQYYIILASIPESGPAPSHSIAYCERFLEFLTDIESQLPTRRYLNTLLRDHLVVAMSSTSNLAKRGRLHIQHHQDMSLSLPDDWNAKDVDSGALFALMVDRLAFYVSFEIDELTSMPLSETEITHAHYERIQTFQKLAFTEFKDTLEEFALENVASIDSAQALAYHLGLLSHDDLRKLCQMLGVRTERFWAGGSADDEGVMADVAGYFDKEFLISVLVSNYERKESQIEKINATSLYPDENILFDDSAIPDPMSFTNTHCLAIPKLNLQFLTLHDYLLRNFELFRLESTYEIRQDIQDVIKRMNPGYSSDVLTPDHAVIKGWARMGIPVSSVQIVEIGPPRLGEKKPSFVQADVTFNVTRFNESLKREWDSLNPHDIVFLVALRMEPALNQHADHDDEASGAHFRRKYGIQYIRGAEVIHYIGRDNKEDFVKIDVPLSELQAVTKRPNMTKYPSHDKRPSNERILRVALDTNQYFSDMKTKEDAYDNFNILIRRRPKENNFKSVLETIRDLMQSELVVPDWLQDVFLGYGDPSSAHYSKVVVKSATEEGGAVELTKDWRDTFLSWEHLVESFPSKSVTSLNGDKPEPPYVVTFPPSMFATDAPAGMTSGVKRKLHGEVVESNEESLVVRTYTPLNMGPYPEDVPKKNIIRFTPMQVEAIHSGMSNGLTVVVGPPGTGKTDVAVQVIANIYHNHPEQHTLIVTHSNQALNQLFEKIMALDIDPRHLLRLGHGQEELLGGELGTWSKSGRVEAFLEKRLQLLARVDLLAAAIDAVGAHGSTCETASYFYTYYVLAKWESYYSRASKKSATLKDIVDAFPFAKYFADAPAPLFKAEMTPKEALDVVDGCWRHISKIFQELEEVRAFELLRSSRDRGNYLLMKEARIVAMTCTHAALKRREMVALGFKYENILMEESAQILEVETFIPLLLQSPDTNTGVSRLRRVILIGDHHQLPPVIQHTAFQRYGNMEQSMFSRFVRLGVPLVELDQQARARPSIAELFRWNYTHLGDLKSVLDANDEFKYGNPGLPFEYQCINVDDYFGKGETIPTRNVIQNMGEAEYAVAMFMYMRLLGYPANKIVILSTYKGQRDLINDILAQRCEINPLYGRPASVQTVDKFQGQQSDYVILSLVRTTTVGFMRDVRRMIVAMSRARLGLYVLCRVQLLETCTELHPIFARLLTRPTDLWVRPSEVFGVPERLVTDPRIVYTSKKVWEAVGEGDDKQVKSFVMAGLAHLGSYVAQMYEQQRARITELKASASQSSPASAST